MGLYKYLVKTWKQALKNKHSILWFERLIRWRRDPVVIRIKRPTRLDRARALGYKAKQGFIIVRVRIRKGALNKFRPRSGRRPKRMGIYGHTPKKSKQLIAEEKAARKYPNLEVLGSYYVWEDGMYKWFEVILIDPNHPAIINDKDVGWVHGIERRVR